MVAPTVAIALMGAVDSCPAAIATRQPSRVATVKFSGKIDVLFWASPIDPSN
jgi:hypothetical protein